MVYRYVREPRGEGCGCSQHSTQAFAKLAGLTGRSLSQLAATDRDDTPDKQMIDW